MYTHSTAIAGHLLCAGAAQRSIKERRGDPAVLTPSEWCVRAPSAGRNYQLEWSGVREQRWDWSQLGRQGQMRDGAFS